MKSQLVRSTPAALLLCGAVLLAGSGGAVAGSMITGAQIKNGTVTSADLKNKTVKPSDLSPATTRKLQRVGAYQRVTQSVVVAPGDNGQIAAQCAPGSMVLGVAAHWQLSFAGPQTLINPANTVGMAYGINNAGANDTLIVDVTCGRVAS
ncbi:hypothetical protein [Nocardioides lijunqiniae]|uniref:hypothetical protein n=1 Tax=Nocardioides lijunqiniae TaxID=2760832 RepID=UPI0018784403|nr:hypothetical protein [Nocardioides lijunqiniae]